MTVWSPRRRVTPIVALMALASAVVSCDESSPPSERSVLAGRSFVATSAQGFDLPVGSALRLTFDGLRLQMSGGCNTGTADYDVVDGLLVMEPMVVTEMACEKPLMDLDAAVMKLLAAGPRVKVRGDELTLVAGGRTLQLTDRRALAPDRPLEGTLWVVGSVVTADTTMGEFGGAVASVLFRDGIAEVSGGCNTGSAVAAVGESTIRFGLLWLTKRACRQSTMELEFMVAVVLQGTVTYRIVSDELTLLNGENGLVLTAAADA